MENLLERMPFQRNENNANNNQSNNMNTNRANRNSNNNINNGNENYNDKKFNQIIIDFFNSIIYTQNCHKISLILILIFLFWIILFSPSVISSLNFGL